MDDCNKSDSPGGSNTDSLIENFKFEITKKSDEDLINIKKLTIQASNKSRESSLSNREIDKKISDLECLIMRLQEELNDLSSASKHLDQCKQEDECEVDYYCPVGNEYKEPVNCPERPVAGPEEPVPEEQHIEDENCNIEEESACNRVDESLLEKENITRSSNHRYPIILRDVGHAQDQDTVKNEEVNTFNETNLINNDQCDEDNKDNVFSMRQKMIFDWEHNDIKDKTKEENNTNNDTESISTMIAELRAEIDDTIHTLNNQN